MVTISLALSVNKDLAAASWKPDGNRMATEKTVFVSFGILSGMEAFALIVSNFTVGGLVRVAQPDMRIRAQRSHDNLEGR